MDVGFAMDGKKWNSFGLTVIFNFIYFEILVNKLTHTKKTKNTIPVFLHFEFDDYEGDLMLLEEENVYSLWRMVPPGIHKFFVSINKIKTTIIFNLPFVENQLSIVFITFSDLIFSKFVIQIQNKFHHLNLKRWTT